MLNIFSSAYLPSLSSGELSFQILSSFINWIVYFIIPLFIGLFELRVFYICWIQVHFQICYLQIFSLKFFWLVILLTGPGRVKVLNFDEMHFINFFFIVNTHHIAFLVCICGVTATNSLPNSRLQKFFLVVILKFYSFTFRPILSSSLYKL